MPRSAGEACDGQSGSGAGRTISWAVTGLREKSRQGFELDSPGAVLDALSNYGVVIIGSADEQLNKDGSLAKVTEATGIQATTQSYKRFMQKVRLASAPKRERRGHGAGG